MSAPASNRAVSPQAPPMPYMDGILDDLNKGEDEEIGVLWERHLHWGYWADPSKADGTVEDFAAASELLAQMVFDVAGVEDGMRVIDCGCGVGGAVASMDERFSDIDLTGLNIDDRQLDVARRRVHASPGNKVQFVHADACALPFEDESFDAVVALECIPHFPSRRRFFREAHRVLKPGGRLGITDCVPMAWALPLLAPAYFKLGFYGRTNLLPAPVSAYHVLGRMTGMHVRDNVDITAETMPTFDLLERYFGSIAPEGADQTRLLAKIMRRGMMPYRLMSFEKQG